MEKKALETLSEEIDVRIAELKKPPILDNDVAVIKELKRVQSRVVRMTLDIALDEIKNKM